MWRMIFMPPPVEPAHPPENMTKTMIISAKGAATHSSKFALA